jgi:hypothetical protein
LRVTGRIEYFRAIFHSSGDAHHPRNGICGTTGIEAVAAGQLQQMRASRMPAFTFDIPLMLAARPFIKPWTNIPSIRDIFQDVSRTVEETIRVTGSRRDRTGCTQCGL